MNSTLMMAIRVIPFFLVSTLLQLSHAQDTHQQDYYKKLFQQLASAKSEQEGRQIESDIWQYWFNQSPTPEIRRDLDKGMERRRIYDLEGAEQYFDDIVNDAPQYAEGYNQRAFARFLREDLDGALTDLEKTLELVPEHFGALSGMYHVLRLQNRPKAAFKALQDAVTLHPWIQERGGLPKNMWPDNYRAIHEKAI